ncbi:hypothetical protein [Paenibacillus terrae]|uniref:hypothetical protein n=1 Tax=Paenibacillus terrae TaxID=159743 RepID=UPI0016568BAE|nr:hypothetical protein [Paenibacillus terrae]
MSSGIGLPLMNMLTILCKAAGVEYILCRRTMKFEQAVQFTQAAPILRMIPGGFLMYIGILLSTIESIYSQKNDPANTSAGSIA